MQRIIGPLPGNMNLSVRIRVVSTVGVKSTTVQQKQHGWTTLAPMDIAERAPEHPELLATIIGQNVILSLG